MSAIEAGKLDPELFMDPGQSSDEAMTDASTPVSELASPEIEANKRLTQRLGKPKPDLSELYSENIFAKMCRVAEDLLQDNEPPTLYPECVFPTGETAGKYQLRESEFWTCGFFPGTLFALLERTIKFPESMPWLSERSPKLGQIRNQLLDLSRRWSSPLHQMAYRTDTHDIGFIVEPALRADWELTGNQNSLSSLVTAARSLASRYNKRTGAIRSWDCMIKQDIRITSIEDDFIVIIDSMCNLDLLYYASAHSGDKALADIATTHAQTVLRTHLRPEKAKIAGDGYQGQLYSATHVVNLDCKTGHIKQRLTGQGYSAESTWSRGQAWAILGYAQAYYWTRKKLFLDAACGAAEYFIHRLETAPSCVEIETPDVVNNEGSPDSASRTAKGRYVPLWDFDAPVGDTENPLRDSSAGVIAANGLLILFQLLNADGQRHLAQRFYDAAILIVDDVLQVCLAREKDCFVRKAADGQLRTEQVAEACSFDAILKNATANWNVTARRRYCDHGLVYGDYYLVEFGNRLLRLGLSP